jgi:microcystin-dependent protein
LAIDFPNSPTTNQDYTVGTTTWTYDGAKWVLKTYNSLHAVPVTAMMLWASTTYPTGWLLADGSAISRVTYADLFAAIGTTYGVGDGSTTFNLPNMVSAGADSPNTIIKVTNSGALEPSAISHAANHTEGGSDVVTVTGNQIANYQSYRNAIINGGMSVAQRSSSVASITVAGYYTVDRWNNLLNSLATWTQSVENDAPTGSGHRKSLKMLCTTADASPAAAAFNTIRTQLEGQNVQHFAKGTASAKKFSLSFWVKANVTGTYIAELYDEDNTRQVSASYTISTTGTWEKKTIIFPEDITGVLDNDNNTSVYLNFWLGAGSNFSSGTLNTSWAAATSANRAAGQTNLAAATSNYWQVTGVQLEVGPVATPFEFEPFETTLRKCQRYYQTIVEGSTNGAMGIGTYYTASQIHTPIRFPVVMRAAPTMTHVSGTNYYTIYRVGAADSFDGWLSDAATPYGIELYTNTGIAGTAGDAGMVRTLSASAYVAVSAEL